jgi:hypothetical protein
MIAVQSTGICFKDRGTMYLVLRLEVNYPNVNVGNVKMFPTFLHRLDTEQSNSTEFLCASTCLESPSSRWTWQRKFQRISMEVRSDMEVGRIPCSKCPRMSGAEKPMYRKQVGRIYLLIRILGWIGFKNTNCRISQNAVSSNLLLLFK